MLQNNYEKMKKILFSAFLLTVFFACKEENKCADSVTYTNDIKPIINATCAISGCHDGAVGSSSPGDYRTFADIKRVTDNGKFKNRVLDLKDMPPSYTTGPKKLTDAQLDLIQCWADKGYKE
jgi:hypothetical protein